MKLARARLTPFALPLAHPFETAHGTIARREGWLLELEAEGVCGHAEASPLPGFELESWPACGRALESLARSALGRDVGELIDGLAAARARAPEARAAHGAWDCALLDLEARSQGCSLADVLARRVGGCVAASVEVNALLIGESPEALEAATLAAQAAGHLSVKLKLGARALEQDLARAGQVAALLEPGVRLRLDANGAWSEAEASRALEALACLPVEWVEQPVAADALDAMRRLRERGAVKIAADESVTGPEGLARVLEAGAADCVVLKPAVAGGPGPALAMAEVARAACVERVVTSFLDSALGVAAALQLAAALPGPLPACGLATGASLIDDLARLDPPRAGRMSLPEAPGLGIVPEPAALERRRTGASLELVA